MDVFVSWTRADADDGPRHLAVALRAIEGLGVWFDEEQIEPFASIPDRVRAGLGEAKVLVAWYSAAYPTRRACREELTLALLAAERAGQGPERVLVVNPEPGTTVRVCDLVPPTATFVLFDVCAIERAVGDGASHVRWR